MLAAAERPLVESHDLLMLDLDGVVYVGDEAVPGAPRLLSRAREAGVSLAYVTNNASRPPAAVADKLRRLGVAADPEDVVTSAQAAARLLSERHRAGSPVAVLGAAGLVEALTDVGLVPAPVDAPDAVALVTGYAPDAPWRDVMRAAVRARDGLPWTASNADLSLPTPFGEAPGHGVLVRMLEQFAGVEAEVAGKPQRPLLDETVRRMGGRRPLMIGDRLDTDIEGAHRAEVESLLVLTGVTDLRVLAAAPAVQRPTYLSPDLSGLFEPHPVPARTDEGWGCGGWRVLTTDGRLVVTGEGSPADWWRAVAVAAWEHLDEEHRSVDVSDVVPPALEAAGSLDGEGPADLEPAR